MYTHEINGERNKGKERGRLVTNKFDDFGFSFVTDEWVIGFLDYIRIYVEREGGFGML
jgi:hypothetical protein